MHVLGCSVYCVSMAGMVDCVVLRARLTSWLLCSWVGVVSAGGRCGGAAACHVLIGRRGGGGGEGGGDRRALHGPIVLTIVEGGEEEGPRHT